MGLIRKSVNKAIKKESNPDQPDVLIESHQPPQQEPIDLGEATAEGVRSLQNPLKRDFITEIQSLDELRITAYALEEAKKYKITFQEGFFNNYLLLKTSYKRQRSKELIEMVRSAKQELQGEASRIQSILLKGRGLP